MATQPPPSNTTILPPAKRPVGRPRTPYDPEVGEELCRRWACEIRGIAQILDDLRRERKALGLSTPSLKIIWDWMESSEDFRARAARARKLRAEYLSDLRLSFALKPLRGEKRRIKNGEEEIEIGDNVARSQLIVQTISKVIAQLAPTIYGDRVAVEHSGTVSVRPVLEMSDQEIQRRLEELEQQRSALGTGEGNPMD